MVKDELWMNPDGSYTRRTATGSWTVPVGDSRYERIKAEHRRRNPDNYTYNTGTGGYTNTVNGVNYIVNRDDPRYAEKANDYAVQNGGIAATGTVNNPTGYENVKGIQDRIYELQQKAAQGQIDAAVKTLQDSIINANQTYDRAAKEQYAAKRIAEKNMGQALAAQWLGNTGVAETTALGNETNYLNNLNKNEAAREQAIRDLQNRIAQTQAAGASTLAEIGANYGNNLTNAYTNFLGQDRNQWNADRDYAMSKEQWAWQVKQAEEELARQNMFAALELGHITPEAAEALKLPSNLTSLYNQVALKNLRDSLVKPNASASGGRSGSSRRRGSSGGGGKKSGNVVSSGGQNQTTQNMIPKEVLKESVENGAYAKVSLALRKSATPEDAKRMASYMGVSSEQFDFVADQLAHDRLFQAMIT